MEKQCAYSECDLIFTARTHNQIYCCADHRNRATNQETLRRYHESRAWTRGLVRICRTPGCNVQLNRYNTEKICGKCENQRAVQEKIDRKNLLERFG